MPRCTPQLDSTCQGPLAPLQHPHIGNPTPIGPYRISYGSLNEHLGWERFVLVLGILCRPLLGFLVRAIETCFIGVYKLSCFSDWSFTRVKEVNLSYPNRVGPSRPTCFPYYDNTSPIPHIIVYALPPRTYTNRPILIIQLQLLLLLLATPPPLPTTWRLNPSSSSSLTKMTAAEDAGAQAPYL